MRIRLQTLGVAIVLGAFTLASACDDDKGTTDPTDTTDTSTDTTDTTDTTTDTVADSTTETTDTTDTTVATTFATLTFAIDDSANKTYDSTDGLAWKGSFSYDASSNVATFDGAWGGPFINLYDDGPISGGGHEPESATASDNIWSVAVKVATPEADQAFEYGAIRGSVDGADGDWIWQGTNGSVTVTAGETGVVSAPGLVIAPHGTVDLRLNLDLANIDSGFGTPTKVEVKSSAWAWAPLFTLTDDGTQDDVASDGIYSMVLSENLGGAETKHTGLLRVGDTPEFVFVLDDVEYKVGGAPPTDGVSAEVEDNGAWVAVTVENQTEGDQNTFITVPEGSTVTPFAAPADHQPINFIIDDSANKTYDDTDGLAWKGSFAYDMTTRVMTFDGSWGGPFAPVYDDGPWSAGGHEPAGATAGDGIWGVTAWVSNAADQAFEFGAIRGSVNGADGDWIWTGSNGTFNVAMGVTTAVDAGTLTIPAHGTVDFRLVIDTSGMGANLATGFDGTTHTDVKVKGSAWGWSEVALTDDATKGDTTAADGFFTFVMSENLAKHDGLLRVGDKPEFIFVLGGVEYKVGGDAATTGVTAWSNALTPDNDSCVTAASGCASETLRVYGGDPNTNSYVEVGMGDEPQ